MKPVAGIICPYFFVMQNQKVANNLMLFLSFLFPQKGLFIFTVERVKNFFITFV